METATNIPKEFADKMAEALARGMDVGGFFVNKPDLWDKMEAAVEKELDNGEKENTEG